MNQPRNDQALDQEPGIPVAGRVVYFDPPPDPAAAAKLGRALAERARARERASEPAEELYRSAIEHLVDAFLLDRTGHPECFREAHALGRHVARRYGCQMAPSESGMDWIIRCGISALHARFGLSYAGMSRGRCSICGAEDLQCAHIPGYHYGEDRCVRVVYAVDLQDVSVVMHPRDPRCYRMDQHRSGNEIESALGRPLEPGEVPLCSHCTSCRGADEGPSPADLDPALWGV